MPEDLVQAAVQPGPTRHQYDRSTAFNENITNVLQGAPVILDVLHDIEAHYCVKGLARGEGLRIHRVGTGHMHVRPGGSQGGEVVEIMRIYVSSPIHGARH